MAKGPAVSICIPTYNGAEFLAETLASANAQTFDSIEIVLSDSGSTDGTLDIIRAFQSRFPIRRLPPPPHGMVANWNYCIAHANGQYVKFLFQDDLLSPGCISNLVSLADEDPGIGLVFSPRKLLISDEARGHPFCQKMERESSDLHLGWASLSRIQDGRSLLADPGLVSRGSLNKIGEPSNILLRRDTLLKVGGFDPRLRQVVDLEMWWRILGQAKVGFVDAPLASFRVHPKQMSVANSDPLQVIAELKRFAEIALQADYSVAFTETTRHMLHRMRRKNLCFEYLYLQYRKPVHWLRSCLGLYENESWRVLFNSSLNRKQ